MVRATAHHVNRKPLLVFAAVLALPLAQPSGARGAETDNLTFRFVPLEDSAPKLNREINRVLGEIAGTVNRDLAASGGTARASDTDVEWTFARVYRRTVLAKFGDRLLPLFGACVERNDCPGWPKFERIVLTGKESIYDESRYTLIARRSLAPSFDLCGVRMGTDKLTHLFSNGFFYYNASRRRGSRLTGADAVDRAAMADERGLMGARSTAVVSPADAAATLAGWRLARSYFFGGDPVYGRDARSGRLVRRRDVDVCRFVSSDFDEVRNPSIFTAGRAKVRRIRAAIAEREKDNAAARTLSAAEIGRLRGVLTARPLPPDHGRMPVFAGMGVLVKWAVAYLTMPRDSRRAIRYLAFPDFNRKDRTPIVMLRVPESRPLRP